jgi:hypothetical protein
VLGGWITDTYDWRWIFFTNVPVGILSLYLSNKFIHDPKAFTQALVVSLDWSAWLTIWLSTCPIRIVLGTSLGDVLRLVLQRGAILAIAGSVIGVVGAIL